MHIVRKTFIALSLVLLSSVVTPLHAALSAISGRQDGAPAVLTSVTAAGPLSNVAVSLSNGFPIWYQDSNGLKLELCLDQTATLQGGGVIVPCILDANATLPVTFPNNFGAEAFYWSAVAVDAGVVSTVNGVPTLPWLALLVMAQEVGFLNIGTDGNQAVFSRLRLRISVPVGGKYRITHPYGTRDYVVSALEAAGGKGINQTQDIGIFAGENFLTSMGDRPAAQMPLPAFPQPVPSSVSFSPNGIVDGNGKNIGPFLTATTPMVTATSGAVYLTSPGTELAPLEVSINPGPFGNAFSIELIGGEDGSDNIPAGVILNAANNSQIVTLNQFQVVGKVFNDGPNTVPVVTDLNVSTSKNSPISIDVAPFVSDIVSASNVHGFNPLAISVFVPPADYKRSFASTTANGGTVQRFVSTATGKTTFTYTPATDFTGLDSFQYVAQDHGGLISTAATVNILVENIEATGNGALFRQKYNKWLVTGISSSTTNNIITVAGDPTTHLSGANEAPAVTSSAKGTASLILGNDSINYRFDISPLPASNITSVQLRHGAPGSNGPVLFDLYNDFSGPINLPMSGQLGIAELQFQTALGIVSIPGAVEAILAGNTYINVLTTANPAGEIRGQLLASVLGSTTVASSGSWKFTGKAKLNPLVRGVNAISANGVRLLGIPVLKR